MVVLIIVIIVVGYFIVRAIGAPERERKRKEGEDAAKRVDDFYGDGFWKNKK